MTDLTVELAEHLELLRKFYASELKEAEEQFRTGNLTESEYGYAVRAIVSAIQQEFFNSLTDEQRYRWRECIILIDNILKDRTGREYQVMVEVLQLEHGQGDALIALQLRMRTKYHKRIGEFRTGTINRRQFIDDLWKLRNERNAKLDEILSQRQYEIVTLHKAVVVRKTLNRYGNIRHNQRE